MGRDDWYRRSSWSDADQVEFFDRLGRSRSQFHKSQYLRIQAFHLEDNGLLKEALNLLARLQQEWPHESQLAQAYNQEASCYLKLGDRSSAISAFRRSIEQENKGGITTNSRLDFLWLVATERLRDLYDEALEGLDDLSAPLAFPIAEFRKAGALALIYGDCGQTEIAQKHAKTALEAAAKTNSGLRYHQNLGLVSNPDRKIIRKLKRLASG